MVLVPPQSLLVLVLMNNHQEQLIRLFSRLPDADRDTVLALAEFLAKRTVRSPAEVPEPTPLPRPTEESVVGAIKRLSATYSMLDKSEMLGETSGLLSQHVLQGRPAREVIQELEQVFLRHYERLRHERRMDQG